MQFEKSFIDANLPHPLDKEELYSYFEKMKLGDKNARNVIILHNIRLVISEVEKKFSNTPYDLKELVSVGLIALIKSVDTFDISYGFYFSTYAIRCIDNEILAFMRNVSKCLYDISLDQPVSVDEEGKKLIVEDTLVDSDSDFVLDYENNETHKIIREIVSELSDEDKNIIIKYFGFMNHKPMSQVEIANELGLSQAQVSRNIKKILKKISIQLATQGIIEVSTKSNKATINNVKQEESVTSRRLKTIYEYFNKYTRDQINEMLSKLSEEEKLLILLRYGTNLDDPISSDEWDKKKSNQYYGKLVPKMKKLLVNPYYTSQKDRIRVIKKI